MGRSERLSEALQLLIISWHNTVRKPKVEVDDILRGPPDLVKQDDKPVFGMEKQTLHFRKRVSKNIIKMPIQMRGYATTSKDLKIKSSAKAKKTYSSPLIFVATERGNTLYVVELVRRYPELLWKVNDNNESIFHIAVKYRREGIYSLLYEIG